VILAAIPTVGLRKLRSSVERRRKEWKGGFSIPMTELFWPLRFPHSSEVLNTSF
jgi:hypothetical protein